MDPERAVGEAHDAPLAPHVCALQARERREEGALDEPEVLVDRRQDRALRVGPGSDAISPCNKFAA